MAIHTPTILVEPKQLAACLENKEILIVAVCAREVFDKGHIPGSILIEPAKLIKGQKPAIGKLPNVEKLEALFSSIGLSKDRRLIVYDDEGGGWAGRLIWTLDVLGHSSYALLNGGIIAWRNEGFPLSTETLVPQASKFHAKLRREVIADLNDVWNSISDSRTKVWDARAPEEYYGTKITALKNGHVPGAVNLDWVHMMDVKNNLKIHDLNRIKAQLAQLGITQQVSVITHCQTHHRSGLTYFVGKLLGLNIKAYDGSWSEWGNHPKTPVE